MGRGTAAETEALKDRIRHEATRLFADRGFAGTSLSAIAEAAGVSKGLVLYHFSDKEALRDAVFDGLVDHWSTMLPGVLSALQGEGDPLDQVLAGAVQVLRDDPHLARFLMRELVEPDGRVKERLAARTMPATELAGQALAGGSDDADPAAALILLGLVLTAVMATFPENPDGSLGRDGLGDRVLDQALRALRAVLA